MIPVLLRVDATGEMLGPFPTWDAVASEVRRLTTAGVGKVTIYREQFVCDFCTVPEPSWVYEAEDTVLGAIASRGVTEIHMTRGSWVACAECHDLIEAEDWGGLIQHCARGWTDRNADLGVPVAVVGEMIASVHATFRAARTDSRPSPIPSDSEILGS